MTKLDEIMGRIVRHQLSRISAASSTELVAKQNQKAVDLAWASAKREQSEFQRLKSWAKPCERQN